MTDIDLRNSIINCAQNLFFLESYASTSIDDIIDTAATSKERFYQHFASKSDILAAMGDRIIADIQVKTQAIVNNQSINAIEKLNAMMHVQWMVLLENLETLWMIHSHMTSTKNSALNTHIQSSFKAMLIPELTKIVTQGVAESHFNLGSAELNMEDVASLIVSIMSMLEADAHQLVLDTERPKSSPDIIHSKYQAAQFAVERILGAPSDTLHLTNLAAIHTWLE